MNTLLQQKTSRFFNSKASSYAVPVFLGACFLVAIIKCFSTPRLLSMPAINYFVGYETGFGGRKLIGTLFGWMLPDYTTAADLLPIVLTANILLAILFILLVWKAAPSINRSTLPFLAVTAVYLVSPYGFTKWFIPELSPLFMETYQMLLVLAWALLFVCCRHKWFYYPATVLVALMGCLIHHTFCCTMFPLMAALFVYDILDGDHPHWGKAAFYGGLCAIMLALFVAIWRFGGMNVDMETLCHRLSQRIDPAIIGGWEEGGLGWKTADFFYYMTNDENRAMNVEIFRQRYVDLIFSLLLMSPMLAMFWYPWLSAARRASSSWARWRYLLVFLAATLLTIPIFFMATDYGRWWFCYFLCQFILLAVMTAIGDRPVTEAMGRLWAFARRFWLLAIAIVIFLAFFLHNEAWYGLHEAMGIWWRYFNK